MYSFLPRSLSTVGLQPHQNAFVYPDGQPDAIPITGEDIGRLNPGEYLNDSLIDFYLKYAPLLLSPVSLLQELTERLARYLRREELLAHEKRFYVFSSFFYKKLIQHRGADSVKNWTKSENIFNYEYLVIPVNLEYASQVALSVYSLLLTA
jgi:Ulp1 family protease